MSQGLGRTYSEAGCCGHRCGEERMTGLTAAKSSEARPQAEVVTRSSMQNLLFPPRELRRLSLLIRPSKSPRQAWQIPHTGPLGSDTTCPKCPEPVTDADPEPPGWGRRAGVVMGDDFQVFPTVLFLDTQMQRAEENPPGEVGWELGVCCFNFLLGGLTAEEATPASQTQWQKATQNKDVSQGIRCLLVLPYPMKQLARVRARENDRLLVWGPTLSGFRHGDGRTVI